MLAGRGGAAGRGALGAAAEHSQAQHEEQQRAHPEEEDHAGVGLEVERAQVDRGGGVAAEQGSDHQQDGEEATTQ